MLCFIFQEIKAWCTDQNGEWVLGKIVSNTGEDVILSLPKGKVLLLSFLNLLEISMSPLSSHFPMIQVVKVHRDTLLRANPDILNGVDDLMQLSYLNEPSVLYNLQYRYSQNFIYVSSLLLLGFHLTFDIFHSSH